MALKIIKQTKTGNLFADTYRVKNGKLGGTGSYYIGGLYTFLSSHNPSAVEIPPPIREELEAYERYCRERKKVWKGRGTRESKLESVRQLRATIIDSMLVSRL